MLIYYSITVIIVLCISYYAIDYDTIRSVSVTPAILQSLPRLTEWLPDCLALRLEHRVPDE